jgi:hypothetical protein
MSIVRLIAEKIGVKTAYHVAALYKSAKHQPGWSATSMPLTISPWLHEDNYMELVEYVKARCDDPIGRPVITSVTKIGK